MQMKSRFGEVDAERSELLCTVKDAESALTMIQPKLTRAEDEIGRLGELMKYQRGELSKLKRQLGDAVHDHGVVHRKLQNREWEMQEIGVVIGAIERIEKDLNGVNCILGSEERLERISSGLKVKSECEENNGVRNESHVSSNTSNCNSILHSKTVAQYIYSSFTLGCWLLLCCM